MITEIKKRGRPSSAENKLSAEKILVCAKNLLKKQKKIPSIRALAREMNIDAMAVYYYFSNKTDLLEALTISLIKEIYLPSGSENWRDELTKICRSYVKLLEENRGLLEIFLSMSVEGPAEVFIQRVNLALSGLDIDQQKMISIIDLLVDYLHGFAYSMNCNSSSELITLDMLEPSLNLIFRLIAQDAD